MPTAQTTKKKKCQIPILGFQCVAKIYKDYWIICTSCLVYSRHQVWLDLCHHFSHIFVWIIASLATNKKFLKKSLLPNTESYLHK